ncbi:hypothetical protein [Metapseudomonas furukawaii]|uniref:Uncharacterized protein n=1 Tax=Metapseudomonas furukawaii TaxID=1149133 RepID=A0AAD1FDC8_METFU|nr:hypothetical protein [Pseudomonas furukawaii]ELS25134.1 Hypothetical protein ppKF707_2114 [Pseudomonas furukawaii]BAU71847.1 hypothetical protein KF707C_1590 [Pseudomonas furukawaii]
MKRPPHYPDYVEPSAPQWRRWWLALLLLWGVQLGLTWALWPEGRPRQEQWPLGVIVPLAWLLALALRLLVWQVGLINRDAHRSTLEAALRGWWCRRGATLPVEHALLLGPAGDSSWQYQGLMAATPVPKPVVLPGSGELALRCQVSLRQAEDRHAALGQHLARQLLALPEREARWSGWRGLAWVGDAAGEVSFAATLVAAGAQLPETRWRLRTLDDLDTLIDEFPRICPEEADGLLCAGVVSLAQAEEGAVPGEAGFAWVIGHRGQLQLHRGEYLLTDEESAAELCAQMQRYGRLDKAPAHCLALDAASHRAFIEGGWQAGEHQLSAHWGALGPLAPFVGMSLALLQVKESRQPCGWLCAQGEQGMAMGVAVHGNG